ncbi:hypothetical protein RHMOL_Rhmol02G0104200 [Rhododendron molle]|uniref:Uncharacterized protein n=1 Tax=Rhododendron molle TaxID=49168 RepID=A0ACC0PQZ0_RHOML|nr:hypothetical protein RHMOL_Rhmol02G0104200 [Rhododendron molle]
MSLLETQRIPTHSNHGSGKRWTATGAADGGGGKDRGGSSGYGLGIEGDGCGGGCRQRGRQTAKLMKGWVTEGWWGWRGGHGEGLGMEGSGCGGQRHRRRPNGGDDGGRSKGRRLGKTTTN